MCVSAEEEQATAVSPFLKSTHFYSPVEVDWACDDYFQLAKKGPG